MEAIVDIQRLSERLVAAFNEEGGVRLCGLAGRDPALSVLEVARLSDLCRRNEARLQQILGNLPPKDRILVWEPQHARQLIEDQHRFAWPVIERCAGVLFSFGVYRQEFYYGGLTADRRQFVLVPDDLYRSYLRERLVACAQIATGSNDLHWLATTIDEALAAHDPDRDWRSPLIVQAESEARAAAYWRGLAGEMPVRLDHYDARRSTCSMPGKQREKRSEVQSGY